jgi:hypothetical protein
MDLPLSLGRPAVIISNAPDPTAHTQTHSVIMVGELEQAHNGLLVQTGHDYTLHSRTRRSNRPLAVCFCTYTSMKFFDKFHGVVINRL